MPRFDLDANEQKNLVPGSSYQYSSIKPDILEATEYTLVDILRDCSGSMGGFGKHINDMTKEIIKSCQKNPRAENLLVRVSDFNSILSEVHGFRLLADINPDDYDEPNPCGSTILKDAVYSSVGAILNFAEQLRKKKMEVNGATFIITDGMDVGSAASEAMIAAKINEAKHGEKIESLVSVLIGMDTGGDGQNTCEKYLQEFQQDTGINQFVWMGEATAGKLAKLGGFISKSISSQSQSLGSGGPSQPIALVI